MSQISELHQALEDAIRTAFPQLSTVEACRLDYGGKIDTPAALVDLEDFNEEPGPVDPAYYRLHWTIFCVLSTQTADVELAAREFAFAMARLIRGNRFGRTDISGPEALSAQSAAFRPGQQGYECWVVSFEQRLSVSTPIDESTLDDFLICHNTVRLDAPAPSAEDHIQLPQE